MIFVVDNLPKSEKRGVVVEGFRDRAADNGRPYADDANLAMPDREASTSRVGGIVRAARTTRLLWQRNGARWLIAFGLCAAQSRATRFLAERLRKMERARNLPGFFEPGIAAHVWQNYDWQSGGEEWSVSAAWHKPRPRIGFAARHFRPQRVDQSGGANNQRITVEAVLAMQA